MRTSSTPKLSPPRTWTTRTRAGTKYAWLPPTKAQRRELQRIAVALYRRVGIPLAPTSPARLARALLGPDAIVYSPRSSSAHGMTTFYDGVPQVHVREEVRSLEVFRFLVGHELAHALLRRRREPRDKKAWFGRDRVATSRHNLEDCCDYLAVALMDPLRMSGRAERVRELRTALFAVRLRVTHHRSKASVRRERLLAAASPQLRAEVDRRRVYWSDLDIARSVHADRLIFRREQAAEAAS